MNFKKNMIIVIFVVFIMLFSVVPTSIAGTNSAGTTNQEHFSNNVMPSHIVENMHLIPVRVAPHSIVSSAIVPYSGNVNVMVTFSFQNQSRLNNLLANLSNSDNIQYHKFLTRTQFVSDFSISQANYTAAVDYFKQFPGLKVKEYSDRVSLQVSGESKEIGKAFNTTLSKLSINTSIYHATSSPELPQYIASSISQVTGLTNSNVASLSDNFVSSAHSLPIVKTDTDGSYPTPVNSNGVQYIYGSDLQVAYDEQSLLNITYPTNEVIATILWAGYNSTGTPVGSFDPSDIYAYYNATLPSYEPHSKVYGVPLHGAVKPGVSASYDVTGANEENTLDLEMVGSSAPGSNIYNVYGPNSTMENIDSAFAFILNPNSTYSALDHVSVITNSWGGLDQNNTAWYQYLEEAQARGITVLASSGDAGDNSNSSKYTGTQVEFPSAMAYNNFGVTAVGGTTLTLGKNLHILNQTAWNVSVSDGGPDGSVGGISTVFSEPNFQLNTEANKVIKGVGRGVPDISAIANNTIIYITINSMHYYGNPRFYTLEGTSVASPIEAGIVAEMDAVLNHYNQSNLGYLNPLIYSLANKQVSEPASTNTIGYEPTGDYNSSLPTLPFYNVQYGRNDVYNATFGYSLVTGWGSIDAYNFTMYVVNRNFTESPTKLKGVSDSLTLNGLNVTSYLYNSTTGTYTTVNNYFNASIQQNLFLANQFGAPIYWIQNVIYINGSQSTGWTVNYTGWVVYPFDGLYPNETLYEYNYPAGKILYMPHTWNVSTWISNYSISMNQTINFEVNSHIISLPVPGAAYIIDAHNYSYVWQGKEYYNDPCLDNSNPGSLDPQFGLVGGPSGGLGDFTLPTSGKLLAYEEPFNMNSYVPAKTQIYNLSVDETGEDAYNLNYTNNGTNSWNLLLKNGSIEQGILDYISPAYNQTFEESGLPSGTKWNLTIAGQTYTSTSTIINVSLTNASYTANISSSSKYFATPSEYIFDVSGSSNDFNVTFALSNNETYIKPVATIYPLTEQILSGSALNTTYTNYRIISLGMAYDTNNSLLFIPSMSSPSNLNEITVYNTTTGAFVGKLSGLEAYDAIYDPNTGFIYTISFTGNITEINPTTLSIVKNITITGAFGELGILQDYGKYLYAFVNGNITIINAATMSNLKEINVGPLASVSPFFYVLGDFAYVANLTGNEMLIVNLTTDSISNVSLPADYNPFAITGYYGMEVLISGMNYSNEIYNISSKVLSTGPMISGMVSSIAYDSLAHLDYISSFSESGDFGNITIINPVNGELISKIPSFPDEFSSVFDKINQNLYSLNSIGGILSSYSLQHYYNITFTESGLPSGTTWNVTINSVIHSSTNSTISILLTNGTYDYSIATTDKTYEAPSGTFKIDGKSVSETVIFTEVKYNITFTESNLPSGTTWYVNLSDGQSLKSTNSTISILLTNGTYNYTVTTIAKGYEYKGSSFTVNGKNLSMNAAFKEVDNYTDYYMIGAAIAVIAVIGLAYYFIKRRK